MIAFRRRLPPSEQREFFYLTAVSWVITTLTAVLVGLGLLFSHFTFLPSPLSLNFVVLPVLVPVFFFYAFFRRDFVVLSLTNGIAAPSVFALVGAGYTYIVMHLSTSLPLWDSTFAAIDRWLGFDWIFLFNWLKDGMTGRILEQAYQSIILQSFAVVLVLSFTGQYTRLHMFIIAGQIGALVTATCAMFMPALGAYPHYEILSQPATVERYLAHLRVLRTTEPVMPLGSAFEGIIQFPSFHAALGIIFLWTFWKTPILRWFAVAVNVAMVLATPISGGHHFIDVPAGVAVAIIGIAFAHWVVGVIRQRIAPQQVAHADCNAAT